MNKKAKVIVVAEIICCIGLAIFGIFLFIDKKRVKDSSKEKEYENIEEKAYYDELTQYFVNMQNLKNYTLKLEISDNHEVYSDHLNEYQIDKENQKVFSRNEMKYYDELEKKQYYYDYYENNKFVEKQYEEEMISILQIFEDSALLDIKDLTKIDYRFYITFNKPNKKIYEFIKAFSNVTIDEIIKMNMIIDTNPSLLNNIVINVEYARFDKKYNMDIKLTYSNINETEIKFDENEYLSKKEKLANKELTDNFTITVNGENHNINVKYHFPFDQWYDAGYNYIEAEIYYDNQQIKDTKLPSGYEQYVTQIRLEEPMFNGYIPISDMKLDRLLNYNLSDIKNKITVDNFYIIQGDNEQYVGIYDYSGDYLATYSNLYILNDKGQSIITLTDKTHMDLSTYDNKKLLCYDRDSQNGYFTKILNDAVLFYSYDPLDEQNPGTAYEYKLILGDTLKFELLNTYNDVRPAGEDLSINIISN